MRLSRPQSRARAKTVNERNRVVVTDPLPPTKGHIGLALVREAAADLGGALQVRGGSGTTVTVTLPPG